MQRSGALARMNFANVAAKKVATQEDYALMLAQMTLIARDMIFVKIKIIVGFSQRPTANGGHFTKILGGQNCQVK